MAVAVIFVCIFFDLDVVKSFPLHMAARAVSEKLGKVIEANVKRVEMTSVFKGFADKMQENVESLADYGIHMIRRLLDFGMSSYEVAWSQVFPTAVAMIPNQAQVVRLHLHVPALHHADVE